MNRTSAEIATAVGAVPGVSAAIACETVDSTNDELRRRSDAGDAGPGTVLIADAQSAGRGRRGRTWHSVAGLGLYLSWLVRPSGPVDLLPRWTLLAALATCDACRQAGARAVELKWPNDLIAGTRKLGGVLADLRTSGGAPELIVGIGVNVHHREADMPPDLALRATSLSQVSGDIMDRADLAERIVRGLVTLGERMERGDWDGVRERWTAMAPRASTGRVRVVDARSGDWTGSVGGVDKRGVLLVRRDGDGRWIGVHDGESVTPIVER